MNSQGNAESRKPDKRPAAGNSANGDASDFHSRGSAGSRGPGGPGRSPEEGHPEEWFPDSNRYRQLGEPIAGGMGVVYKALDVNLDIEVAIKRIRPELAANVDLIIRFEREAKLQRRLRHRNLVSVLDYARDSVGPYIVMDWIEGQSLAMAIDKSGPMPWQRAAVLIGKIANALQVAHDAGIIHRDIKPANILLDSNGEPFITDFGLARIETTQSHISETATNAMLGTINYASPEQQRNPRNASFQSDIWSLGATLYKLVTGYDVLAMRESLIPEPIRPIVLKATEHAIDARYGTMRLMSQALQTTLREASTRGTSASPKPAGGGKTNAGQKTGPEGSDLAELWRATQERMEKAHKEAQEIVDKRQDYAEAVRILETVPNHLQDADLLAVFVQKRDRIIKLDSVVRDCVARVRSKGLRDALEELLNLQPARNDLKRLLEQLPPEVNPKRAALFENPADLRDNGTTSSIIVTEAASKPVPPGRSAPSRVPLVTHKPERSQATTRPMKTRRWILGSAGGLVAVGLLRAKLLPTSTPSEPPSEPTPDGPHVEKKPASPERLVAPFEVKQAKAAQEAWAKHLGIGTEVTNSLGMKFRVIPPGTFDIGSPPAEPKRSADETLHKVTITQPKLVGVYPVTQGEYTKVLGSNPGHFKIVAGEDTSRFPVENVSWDDTQEFLTRLNQQHILSGWRYRLLTEAEWEYACRAGTVTPFWFGRTLNGTEANCDGHNPYQTGEGSHLGRPSVVGSYAANPFGLHDQHGNVWEWCQDWFGDYETSVTQDPTGPTSGSSRVLRGGSWNLNADFCRSARRNYSVPSYRGNYIGFRVMCELS